MKVLKLTLHRRWFDLIATGEKVFEYREYKPFWIARLLCENGVRGYDEVLFTNGYGAHRPYIRCEFVGMAVMDGKDCDPENGEPLTAGKNYFVIRLGKILDVGNT